MARKPPNAMSIVVGLLILGIAVVCGFSAIIAAALGSMYLLDHRWSRGTNFAIYAMYLAGAFGLAAPVLIAWWIGRARSENDFFRFSLRTLLIATTLVAVVLGLGVWLAS
jgi:MFS family permease